MKGQDIFLDMRKMRWAINRLFGETENTFDDNDDFTEKGVNYRKAMTDFQETGSEFIVNVELPGIEKENIKLDVLETGIEIRAEKKHKSEIKDEKNGTYNFSKSYAGFSRVIPLPENADLDNVYAIYKNGMLKVAIPKKKIVKGKKEVRIK